MKREERGREKEIVHRMQLDAAQGRDDKHEKEKEEQRNRRKEADPARQRARLQLFGHRHRDLITGYQVLVIPIQFPTISRLVLLRRRQGVVWKINVFKVRGHLQRKVKIGRA